MECTKEIKVDEHYKPSVLSLPVLWGLDCTHITPNRQSSCRSPVVVGINEALCQSNPCYHSTAWICVCLPSPTSSWHVYQSLTLQKLTSLPPVWSPSLLLLPQSFHLPFNLLLFPCFTHKNLDADLTIFQPTTAYKQFLSGLYSFDIFPVLFLRRPGFMPFPLRWLPSCTPFMSRFSDASLAPPHPTPPHPLAKFGALLSIPAYV